ncbi:SMP-30/gluconolactonase/LRE family protein [Acidisoma silvae]|uniref:SMP-30/gluconolactonase/LRE family protein n=1 Tax=Acidisoma silvae TaxID=2802396 RepID=A0A964DZZ1_9PROT|nr:SMP-30/gluconolactonase/LRE family protein [Acidisoma silvae]MCB8876617.1 SMP-30/gluconolactonase/LRE family protein [Acidisoma silvae]
MTYEILDPRFNKLIFGPARLEKLHTGMRWAEGPVYVPAAKSLLWSDIPNNRLMRFDETDSSVSVFEYPCGNQNGHTLDHQGRVIACEHSGRRVSRLEHDGTWTNLVDNFQGKRLNSPNDAIVKSDGSIWFTDPTYGIDTEYEGDAAESEIGSSDVYRLDPETGEMTMVVSDLLKPNGLAFSPKEDLLYIADTGFSHDPLCTPKIVTYTVATDGRSVSRKDVFATMEGGLYDGFRVDRSGNIWTSAGEAVAIYAPDGVMIGRIPIGEIVANVTFGGPKRNRLYITAQTSLYSIFVNAHPAGS